MIVTLKVEVPNDWVPKKEEIPEEVLKSCLKYILTVNWGNIVSTKENTFHSQVEKELNFTLEHIERSDKKKWQ